MTRIVLFCLGAPEYRGILLLKQVRGRIIIDFHIMR